MKTRITSIIVIIVLVCSCKRTLPDEEFTIARTPYVGNEIRLDGCYVSDPDERNKYCEYDFFYSNGVMFASGDLLGIKNINQFTGGIDDIRKHKSTWGIFRIIDDSIFVQKWNMGVYTTQYIVYNRFYKIINDTTLSCDLLNNGYIRYYHFKPFYPKPDSTNVFIK